MQKYIAIVILSCSLLSSIPSFPQQRGDTHCTAPDFDPSKIAMNRYFYGRKVYTASLFDTVTPSDPQNLSESSESLDSLFLPAGYYQMELLYTLHYTNPEKLQQRREQNYKLNEEDFKIKVNIDANTPPEERERILGLKNIARRNQENGLTVARFGVTVWNETHSESIPYYRSLKDCIEKPQEANLKNFHPIRPQNFHFHTNKKFTSEREDIQEQEPGRSTFAFLVENPGNFSLDLRLLGNLDSDITLENGRVEFYYYTGKENEFLEKESYFLGKSEGILKERITRLKELIASEQAHLHHLEKQREDLALLLPLLSSLLLDYYDKDINVAQAEKNLLALKEKLTQAEYIDIATRISDVLKDTIDISKLEQAHGKSFSELLQSLSPEQVQQAYETQKITLDQKERLLQLIEIRNFVSKASLELDVLSQKIETLDDKITELTFRQQDVMLQEKLLYGEFYEMLKNQLTVLRHHSLW